MKKEMIGFRWCESITNGLFEKLTELKDQILDFLKKKLQILVFVYP